MPSIKQLKDEIAGAGYFNDEQKRWLLTKIDQALTQINLRAMSAPKKIRKVKTGSTLLTLEQWEVHYGSKLGFWAIDDWVQSKGLHREIVQALIEEFRAEMLAKGKQYADFRAAFKTYLNKGYLSKRLDQCKLKTATTFDNRGVQL